MRRFLILFTFLLLPSVASAGLSFEPGSPFKDVRSTSFETPSIQALFKAGAMSGYKDGRFLPSRAINRAEFLKVALLAHGDKITHATHCFTDVGDQWFAPYVCTLAQMGIVNGYSLGTFQPQRPVQYDEALKILTSLYGYSVVKNNNTKDWAEPYYQAAALRGVDLPVTIRFNTRLTRGQAARLIAAFQAEAEGTLVTLRLAEAGQFITSSSSSLSSSSLSSSSSSLSLPPPPALSSSTSSSVALSSSASSAFEFIRSRFLMVGSRTPPLALIDVPSSFHPFSVFSAEVLLSKEARSIKSLELVTPEGQVLLTLIRRTNTSSADYRLFYDSQIPATLPVIDPSTIQSLAVRALLRTTDDAGFSGDVITVQKVLLTIRETQSSTTKNIVATGPFSTHQTSFGMLQKLERVSPEVLPLRTATGVTVLQFSLTSTGRTLTIQELVIDTLRTGSVLTSRWTLSTTDRSLAVECTENATTSQVSCSNLLPLPALESGRTVTYILRADIVGIPGSMLWTRMVPGAISSQGSIRWSDGTGDFRWTEFPVLTGSVLK